MGTSLPNSKQLASCCVPTARTARNRAAPQRGMAYRDFCAALRAVEVEGVLAAAALGVGQDVDGSVEKLAIELSKVLAAHGAAHRTHRGGMDTLLRALPHNTFISLMTGQTAASCTCWVYWSMKQQCTCKAAVQQVQSDI